jgi:hypothetical protein
VAHGGMDWWVGGQSPRRCRPCSAPPGLVRRVGCPYDDPRRLPGCENRAGGRDVAWPWCQTNGLWPPRRGTRPGGNTPAAPKCAGYAGMRARPTNLADRVGACCGAQPGRAPPVGNPASATRNWLAPVGGGPASRVGAHGPAETDRPRRNALATPGCVPGPPIGPTAGLGAGRARPMPRARRAWTGAPGPADPVSPDQAAMLLSVPSVGRAKPSSGEPATMRPTPARASPVASAVDRTRVIQLCQLEAIIAKGAVFG